VRPLRERLTSRLIRAAGRPFPPGWAETVRDFGLFSMGYGSAHLGVDASGETALLEKLADRWSDRDEVTVFDVGGYGGEYARAVRAAFGPRARVHTFEPNPVMYSSLLERVAGDGGITCHQLALGKEPGSARLFVDRVGSSRASLVEETFNVIQRPATESFEVTVATVDDVAAAQSIDRIDVIKVDVEGHELSVLQGAKGLLTRAAVDVVQFEFGEANVASRTYLRDFWELLGPRYDFFRLTARGPVRFQYRTKYEVFALETNYVAVARAA
jgi:FkbM family methyltransferase